MRLDFGQVWLNPVATLADATTGMAFEVASIEHDPTVTVRVDAYAGGNFRAVRTPGKQRQAKVTLLGCTDEQVAWLKDQHGELLCYRDPRSEKFFGIYGASDQPSFVPSLMPNHWNVSLTVDEVTYDEGAVPL